MKFDLVDSSDKCLNLEKRIAISGCVLCLLSLFAQHRFSFSKINIASSILVQMIRLIAFQEDKCNTVLTRVSAVVLRLNPREADKS
jgi:hypothetical protein